MPEKLTVHSKRKAGKKHGFMVRLSTAGGRKVVKRRKLKGRKRI